MNFKPGDFFFGLVEFLGYLAPGAILSMTLPEVVSGVPVFFVVPESGDATAMHWSVFLLTSYILGHFIHHAGALVFNPLYKRFYLSRKRRKHQAFIDMAEEKLRKINSYHTDLVRVADSYIRMKHPGLTSELGKHEANSKLFRGLSLLCIYLCFYPANNYVHIMLLLVLAFLSFSRFANQRWKRQLLAYEFFCVIGSDKQGS